MGDRGKLAIVALLFVVFTAAAVALWIVTWRECRAFGHSWWYCAARGG